MRTSGPGLLALGLAVLLAVIAATPAGSGEAAPPQVAGARASVVFHGSRGAPVVALTFDDGWSATQCEKVFDVLRTRRVPATFFPYAWAVMSAPSFWRRLAAAGYPIGNHTVRHVDLTKLHPAARDREIRDARAIIERITNRPTVALLRPPYGAYNAAVLASALAAGYPTVVMWVTRPLSRIPILDRAIPRHHPPRAMNDSNDWRAAAYLTATFNAPYAFATWASPPTWTQYVVPRVVSNVAAA